MKFYTKQHKFYCGIDLHSKNMYVCILDQAGEVQFHENLKCSGQNLLTSIRPYIDDIVIAVECIFAWYWVADFCASLNIPFILGHALYMKAIHHFGDLIGKVEWYLEKHAKEHTPKNLCLLRTVPGIGITLAMVILYEIHDIARFPRVQDFASYARLVKCTKESAGKKYGTGNSKIGNAHLKWAFSEAAVLFLRCNEPAKKYHARLVSKHGRGKALSIIAHRLGRAVYFMLKNQEAFEMNKFLA